MSKFIFGSLFVCCGLLPVFGCQARGTDECNDETCTNVPEVADPLPKESFEALFGLGNYYFDKSDYNEAERKYTEALSILSDDPDALYNRGLARLSLQKYRDAASDLRRVTKLDPKHAYNWANLGVACLELGHKKEAWDSMQHAVELRPNDAKLWSTQGMIYRETARYDVALESYAKALELNPTYVLAWEGRGEVYVKQKNYVAAVNDFSKAINLDPKFVGLYRSRAEVYDRVGMPEKAAADRETFQQLLSKPIDAAAPAKD